jgi:hypothetical protein
VQKQPAPGSAKQPTAAKSAPAIKPAPPENKPAENPQSK